MMWHQNLKKIGVEVTDWFPVTLIDGVVVTSCGTLLDVVVEMTLTDWYPVTLIDGVEVTSGVHIH